jgi:predicted secreted protein
MAEEFKVDLGLNAKAYLGGVVLEDITDVTVNLQRATADVTTRRAQGWRQKVGTLRECSADFDIISTTDSVAVISQIQENFLNNDGSTIDMAFLTKEGGIGPVGWWSVSQFQMGEPLEDAVKFSVTVELAKYHAFSGTTTDSGSSS